MDRLKNILVGVDLEDGGSVLTAGSRAAARQALWLAGRTGARVEFLHSTHVDPETASEPVTVNFAAVDEQLATLARKGGTTVTISPIVPTEERPWVALTHRALEGEADLIVVAKRNHTRRDDRLLGSVSMKLVRKCPAPVWVIMPEHDTPHRCVVAATDLSPVGDRATEYGAYIARAEECAFYVAHAWQVPMELQLSAARVSAEETARRKDQIASAALAHIRAVPAVSELGERAEVFLACATPSSTILNLVEKTDPDLVVMGTVSRGGVAGMLVGNTAEKLLYRLDCSLLTVKPDDFVCPLVSSGD
jgi:universal stress protein E